MARRNCKEREERKQMTGDWYALIAGIDGVHAG